MEWVSTEERTFVSCFLFPVPFVLAFVSLCFCFWFPCVCVCDLRFDPDSNIITATIFVDAVSSYRIDQRIPILHYDVSYWISKIIY